MLEKNLTQTLQTLDLFIYKIKNSGKKHAKHSIVRKIKIQEVRIITTENI